MVKVEWNAEDVALALYDYMERQQEFDDYATTLFKGDCNDLLFKIDDKLGKMMEYEDAEELITWVLEYGELKCKQYFIKGYQTGVAVKNSMKTMRKTYRETISKIAAVYCRFRG